MDAARDRSRRGRRLDLRGAVRRRLEHQLVQAPFHTARDADYAPLPVTITLGRDAAMRGSTFGNSMGLTTWAAFTGSDAHADIDGDFAMTPDEVQPVLRTLRRANIHVLALHNHMAGETPAYHFTHFWANGPAIELVRGFRAALDAQRGVGRERQ